MTRRADKNRDEPLLFDLPLETNTKGAPKESSEKRRAAAPPSSRRAFDEDPAFDEDDFLEAREQISPAAPSAPSGNARHHLEIVSSQDLPEDEESEGPGSLIGSRLAAGGADLLIHAAVLVVALGGCVFLGVRPELSAWPALGLFLLSFSFLYTVVPLAFWGHTPGMAWARLASQNDDGEPLTFDQTARRWLGAVLTTAFLGLPLLLFGKRSLADRLSHSQTLALR